MFDIEIKNKERKICIYCWLCEIVVCVCFFVVYEIYLSVRRGGDILVWFSPLNGGSCFGCKTGVRPHLSIKSIREMVDDVVQGTIILLSCICTLKKVHLLICSGYDTFSDRYKSANEYIWSSCSRFIFGFFVYYVEQSQSVYFRWYLIRVILLLFFVLFGVCVRSVCTLPGPYFYTVICISISLLLNNEHNI